MKLSNTDITQIEGIPKIHTEWNSERMDIPGAGKMERVLAPEPDILCSIPGAYMVEEEK